MLQLVLQDFLGDIAEMKKQAVFSEKYLSRKDFSKQIEISRQSLSRLENQVLLKLNPVFTKIYFSERDINGRCLLDRYQRFVLLYLLQKRKIDYPRMSYANLLTVIKASSFIMEVRPSAFKSWYRDNIKTNTKDQNNG